MSAKKKKIYGTQRNARHMKEQLEKITYREASKCVCLSQYCQVKVTDD